MFYLRCQMEIIERHEVPLEQSREEAEINSVSKLTVQIIHFQVDLENEELFTISPIKEIPDLSPSLPLCDTGFIP